MSSYKGKAQREEGGKMQGGDDSNVHTYAKIFCHKYTAARPAHTAREGRLLLYIRTGKEGNGLPNFDRRLNFK